MDTAVKGEVEIGSVWELKGDQAHRKCEPWITVVEVFYDILPASKGQLPMLSRDPKKILARYRYPHKARSKRIVDRMLSVDSLVRNYRCLGFAYPSESVLLSASWRR